MHIGDCKELSGCTMYRRIASRCIDIAPDISETRRDDAIEWSHHPLERL
jgi:hypothetical protein